MMMTTIVTIVVMVIVITSILALAFVRTTARASSTVTTATTTKLLLLLGVNENRSSLSGSQSQFVGQHASFRLLVATVSTIAHQTLVVVHLKGCFFGVGPSQLDGASVRAAGMIPQHLWVRTNLAVSKGYGTIVTATAAVSLKDGRRRPRQRRFGRNRNNVNKNTVHDSVINIGGVFEFLSLLLLFFVVGQSSFQGRPRKEVVVVLMMSTAAAAGRAVARFLVSNMLLLLPFLGCFGCGMNTSIRTNSIVVDIIVNVAPGRRQMKSQEHRVDVW